MTSPTESYVDSVATFVSDNVRSTLVSLNVQRVTTPDWISRLSTPVLVAVPVAVGDATSSVQEAESSCQPLGTASLRSSVVVGSKEISCCWPLPLIVQLVSPVVAAAEALKGKGVASFGVAFFTMVRKPTFGAKTQSDGSDPGTPEG